MHHAPALQRERGVIENVVCFFRERIPFRSALEAAMGAVVGQVRRIPRAEVVLVRELVDAEVAAEGEMACQNIAAKTRVQLLVRDGHGLNCKRRVPRYSLCSAINDTS